MSYLDWKVGDRVVFVGYPAPAGVFADGKRINRVSFLTVGEIYTILDMCIRDRYAKGKWTGPSFHVGFEDVEHGKVWHHCAGFRKVQPRKTDIAVFEAILHGARVPEDA